MQHGLTLTETDANGRELWECDECGRKVLLAWEPFFRDVIIRGDESAVHTGGKGGLRMSAAQAAATPT